MNFLEASITGTGDRIMIATSFPSTEQMVAWTLNSDFARMGRLAPVIALAIMLTLLDVILKVFALWKAGNHKQLAWFICLFLFNTCGILPAIYLIRFQKKSPAEESDD
jgi:hypothetical protein